MKMGLRIKNDDYTVVQFNCPCGEWTMSRMGQSHRSNSPPVIAPSNYCSVAACTARNICIQSRKRTLQRNPPATEVVTPIHLVARGEHLVAMVIALDPASVEAERIPNHFDAHADRLSVSCCRRSQWLHHAEQAPRPGVAEAVENDLFAKMTGRLTVAS